MEGNAYMTIYPNPGTPESNVAYRQRYDNYIGGDWVAPASGEYFDNMTPVTGEVFCQVCLLYTSDAADK